MRVISQDGNVDLPYEQIVVCHAMENVAALHNEKKYILGKYSSQEKAYKAMEMLREVYAGMPIVIQNVNTPKGAVKTLEVVQGCGIGNIVFQFPQDDEIEV